MAIDSQALRRWQSKQGFRATYRNLLELFVQAGHTQSAEVVCEVLRKKCEYKCSCMHSSVDPQNVSHDSLYLMFVMLSQHHNTPSNLTTMVHVPQVIVSTAAGLADSPCALSLKCFGCGTLHAGQYRHRNMMYVFPRSRPR